MKDLSKVALLAFTLALFTSCEAPQKDASTEAGTAQKAMQEKIVAANKALFAAWNSGDAAIMEANLVADFSRKQNGEPGAKSRDEYIALMQFFRTAVPDLTFTYELVTVDANRTFTKWTTKGTNNGMFGDQPATGRSSVTHGFTILTYNDEGKAISEEAYYDQLSYLQAWGYTVVPPATE